MSTRVNPCQERDVRRGPVCGAHPVGVNASRRCHEPGELCETKPNLARMGNPGWDDDCHTGGSGQSETKPISGSRRPAAADRIVQNKANQKEQITVSHLQQRDKGKRSDSRFCLQTDWRLIRESDQGDTPGTPVLRGLGGGFLSDAGRGTFTGGFGADDWDEMPHWMSQLGCSPSFFVLDSVRAGHII